MWRNKLHGLPDIFTVSKLYQQEQIRGVFLLNSWKSYSGPDAFYSINVEVWEERVMYNFESLLSDIGGQLGLLSGISVITLFKFIYLMFLLAKYFVKRESCRASKSDEEDLPDQQI